MKARQSSNLTVYLLLIATTSIWGGGFVVTKAAVSMIPPMTLAALRFFLSSLFLIPWAIRVEGRIRPRDLWDVLLFAFLGFTGAFLYNVFFIYGVKLNGAGESALIVAANPIVVGLLSALFLGERFGARHVVGLLLSLLGVATIISGGDLGAIARLDLRPERLLLVGGVLSWAVYSVVGKVVMARYSPLTTTAYASAFGFLWLLPLGVREYLAGEVGRYDLAAVASLLYMSLFMTVLAFVWWYEGVRRIGAGRTAVFVNLMPVSAVIFSAAFLGEPVTVVHLLGGTLVISGVLVTTTGRAPS